MEFDPQFIETLIKTHLQQCLSEGTPVEIFWAQWFKSVLANTGIKSHFTFTI